MRKIGFVGYESEDIILYLAACLQKAGKKVAIEDKTEAGLLLRMLDSGKVPGETGWYCGIRVTGSLSGKEVYDYVFLLFGYRVQHPKLYECEYLIFVTDEMPAHARLLHEVGQWERKQAMLIRDYIEAKHGSKYLELLVGQKQEQVILLPWEARDMRKRYSLGQEENIDLTGLSAGMKHVIRELLLFLASECPEVTGKQNGRRCVWES